VLCPRAKLGHQDPEVLICCCPDEDGLEHTRRERGPNRKYRLVATYSRANRNRSELPMTETELKLIAAAATIGLSNRPNAA
jgi:hypothetical protein